MTKKNKNKALASLSGYLTKADRKKLKFKIINALAKIGFDDFDYIKDRSSLAVNLYELKNLAQIDFETLKNCQQLEVNQNQAISKIKLKFYDRIEALRLLNQILDETDYSNNLAQTKTPPKIKLNIIED